MRTIKQIDRELNSNLKLDMFVMSDSKKGNYMVSFGISTGSFKTVNELDRFVNLYSKFIKWENGRAVNHTRNFTYEEDLELSKLIENSCDRYRRIKNRKEIN